MFPFNKMKKLPDDFFIFFCSMTLVKFSAGAWIPCVHLPVMSTVSAKRTKIPSRVDTLDTSSSAGSRQRQNKRDEVRGENCFHFSLPPIPQNLTDSLTYRPFVKSLNKSFPRNEAEAPELDNLERKSQEPFLLLDQLKLSPSRRTCWSLRRPS